MYKHRYGFKPKVGKLAARRNCDHLRKRKRIRVMNDYGIAIPLHTALVNVENSEFGRALSSSKNGECPQTGNIVAPGMASALRSVVVLGVRQHEAEGRYKVGDLLRRKMARIESAQQQIELRSLLQLLGREYGAF